MHDIDASALQCEGTRKPHLLRPDGAYSHHEHICEFSRVVRHIREVRNASCIAHFFDVYVATNYEVYRNSWVCSHGRPKHPSTVSSSSVTRAIKLTLSDRKAVKFASVFELFFQDCSDTYSLRAVSLVVAMETDDGEVDRLEEALSDALSSPEL